MTIAAMCFATMCTIVVEDTDPAIHGINSRIYILRQTIQEKMAVALYYETAIHLLYDLQINQLLDDRFSFVMNSKLQELNDTIEHAKTKWRDAQFCYDIAIVEMQQAATYHLNTYINPCVIEHSKRVIGDMYDVKKLVNNLVDGQRQLNVMKEECANRTDVSEVDCLTNTLETIETNINAIHDVADAYTERGVESYLVSFSDMETCVLNSIQRHSVVSYEIYKNADNCIVSTHRPLCPYVEPEKPST